MIGNGVLFEWPSSYAMAGPERFDAGVNRAYGEILKGRDKTSPAYKRAGDFVAAGDAYSCGRPLFGKVFSDELQVSVVDLSGREPRLMAASAYSDLIQPNVSAVTVVEGIQKRVSGHPI